MPYTITLSVSDPIGSVYKFMTEKTLHNPEVSILADTERFYTRANLPSEADFRKVCKGAIITAVASFDEEDLRRVNLTITPVGTMLSVYKPSDKEARDDLCQKLLM